MKRAKKNDIPAKTPPRNSGIFQKQPRAAAPNYDMRHKVGDPNSGLTTNRSRFETNFLAARFSRPRLSGLRQRPWMTQAAGRMIRNGVDLSRLSKCSQTHLEKTYVF